MDTIKQVTLSAKSWRVFSGQSLGDLLSVQHLKVGREGRKEGGQKVKGRNCTRRRTVLSENVLRRVANSHAHLVPRASDSCF